MLTKLEEIEQKYKFNYPSLYKELYKDGMIVEEADINWYKEVYPKVKNNPPLLLFGHDIQMLTFDEMEDYYEILTDEEWPGINQELNFIPFLRNAAGDSICFYMNEADGENIPVAYVPHDDSEFEIQAKNLQDYIFREMLMAVVDIWDTTLITDDFENNINNMYKSHKKYLTERQQSIVKDVYSRELKEYKYKISDKYESEATGLLTYDEYDKILKKEIDFPLLGKELPLFAE